MWAHNFMASLTQSAIFVIHDNIIGYENRIMVIQSILIIYILSDACSVNLKNMIFGRNCQDK